MNKSIFIIILFCITIISGYEQSSSYNDCFGSCLLYVHNCKYGSLMSTEQFYKCDINLDEARKDCFYECKEVTIIKEEKRTEENIEVIIE